MRRDAEVAELELFVFADEDVERCEIAMQRLSLVQRIEGAEDAGDLTADESLGLPTLSRQPRAEIAMLREFHRQAVAHPRTVRAFRLREAIEHAQRTRLAREQLREVGLAKPGG